MRESIPCRSVFVAFIAGNSLSIATRKAGMPVDCPKCSHPNTVPGKGRESKSTSTSSERPAKVSRAFESKNFDEWLGRSEKGPEEEPKEDFAIREDDSASHVTESAEAGGSESASAVEEPWRREPEGLPTPRTRDLDDYEVDDVSTLGQSTVPMALGAVVLLLVAFGIGILVGRYAFPAQGGDKPALGKPHKPVAQAVQQVKVASVPVALPVEPSARNLRSPEKSKCRTILPDLQLLILAR